MQRGKSPPLVKSIAVAPIDIIAVIVILYPDWGTLVTASTAYKSGICFSSAKARYQNLHICETCYPRFLHIPVFMSVHD